MLPNDGFKLAIVILLLFSVIPIDPRLCAAVPDGAALRSGDIVFRYGTGLWSIQFRALSSREQRFSHVGILQIHSGQAYVIDASADDRSGQGEVRRESIETFLAPARNAAIYRISPDADLGEAVAQYAAARIGTPFDLRFDLEHEDALYCSELVWRSVNPIAGEAIITTTVIGGKTEVAIDDCYLHPSFTLVWCLSLLGQTQP